MNDRPVAIGPTSRTVVGDVPKTAVSATPPLPALPPPGSKNWKRYLLPASLLGLAAMIALRYR